MFVSRVVGITFIIALAALCVLAQTAPQAAASPETPVPPGTGSITGQVVDENGQPLKGVTVQAGAMGSTMGRGVTTDREGQFHITGLQPADYSLSASLPSYLRDQEKWPRRAFHIGDRVTLPLIKGGVVTGRVTNASGDPVVTVTVRAQLVRDTYGRVITNGWGTEARPTDDRGIYRIYGLMAGTYIVYAGGPGRSRGASEENVFQFDVPSYAPSSTRETAAEFSVGLGEEVNADIRYRGEHGRVISGEVAVPATSHRAFAVSLITGGAESQFAETTYQSENKRTFVFSGVGDGDYRLIAQSYGPEEDLALSEPKQVTVQGTDITGIKLTTKLLGSVSGRVVLEETRIAACDNKEHPLSTETSVAALPRDDEATKQIPQFIRSRSEPGRPDETGNFVLKNLARGAYHFGPSLRARQWYVNSITFVSASTNAATKVKQVDATRVWTNVATGDRLNGLTIAMAQGGVTLRGELSLSPGERAPEGSFLYLAPIEREKANDVLRFFTTRIERNGWFEINNIAPGRYWILAQMGGESSAMSAKVRLPNETETRAQIRREAEAAKTEIEFKPCQDVVNFRLPFKSQDK